MLSKIFAAAAGTSLLLATAGAQAMPAGAIDGASAAPQVTLAAEGCGVGFARGPAGGCRPIGGRRVVVVPARPAVIVRRPVGCGVRVGPIGVRTPC